MGRLHVDPRIASDQSAGRKLSRMAYDSLHGQVVLFGRQGMWLWDGSNWTQPSPKTSPGPRFGCAMAYDSKRMQVVLFGGQDAITNQYQGDTWVWDGFNWTQISPANSPRPRAQHTLVYDSVNQQVVLFGGSGNFQSHIAANDTWTWDGANWTEQFPTNSPPLRYDSKPASRRTASGPHAVGRAPPSGNRRACARRCRHPQSVEQTVRRQLATGERRIVSPPRNVRVWNER
jgi:hypothetical protein